MFGPQSGSAVRTVLTEQPAILLFLTVDSHIPQCHVSPAWNGYSSNKLGELDTSLLLTPEYVAPARCFLRQDTVAFSSREIRKKNYQFTDLTSTAVAMLLSYEVIQWTPRPKRTQDKHNYGLKSGQTSMSRLYTKSYICLLYTSDAADE